ncbi:MAG: PadR family transcriptional regulator, partial [Clostridiales bacterium]|nr:PadR family transcriptional regulator [Clostridiales bacterium]
MAESDLIRGNVDTIILKVLYDGDRYGYDLIRQINARGDGQWEIKQPTVYACLKRLEKQGFVTSYWGSAESDGGRRKYYTLSERVLEVF